MTVESVAGIEPPVIDLDSLVRLRRYLHQNPELRFAEFDTAAFLAQTVAPHADRVHTGVGGTGVMAELDSGIPGPTVLLRADMDAYPVEETTGESYASTRPGATHACGHDVHMAVMVGVLQSLAAARPSRGRVHVLFQPAEEIPFGQGSGARAVLESGVLADNYDAVLGLHCWPQLEAGSIGINSRISMAAKDGFRIEVIGVGAHAATPASGRDAILAVSKLVSALHATLSRRRNPDEMVAFNIGTISGGVSQSLVAPQAAVTGTLRTHDEAVRSRLKSTIEQVCAGAAVSQDLRVELVWADAMPAVVNDEKLVTLATVEIAEVAKVVSIPTPPMTSDDFALFAERWPGLYLKLGVASPGVTDAPSLHSPNFTIDENCLLTGVSTVERLTRLVLSSAERN